MIDERKDDLPLAPTSVPAEPEDAGVPEAAALASGLQPGGMVPSGGIGPLVGATGTGGGSTADRTTGDMKKNEDSAA